jgi:hypothetical protein
MTLRYGWALIAYGEGPPLPAEFRSGLLGCAHIHITAAERPNSTVEPQRSIGVGYPNG